MFSLSLLQSLPWLLPVLVAASMALLAWRWKIYPRMSVLLPMAALLMLSLIVAFQQGWAWLYFAASFSLVAILLIDLISIARPLALQVGRSLQRAASLAKAHAVTIHLDFRGKRRASCEVIDDLPAGWRADPVQQTIALEPGKRMEVYYSLFASRRGAYSLEYFYVRRISRLRFWARQERYAVHSEVHVYPDMKQLSKYAMLARTNRLSLIGVRRTRRAGQDNNFERLRDYLPDDNYRHLDWRATARRQKLTVRQFQSDQSQRVIFMLDCGRMMTNLYQGLSLLDYAMNSLLMLSYVALKQGDSVGLICFSDKVHDFVPLRGGRTQMNHLLHASFDRFPELTPSRFDEAFLYLSIRCRRRAMVVLITNLLDESSADQVVGYLDHLSGRHLPVLALLRDHRMFDAADNPDLEDDVLYRSAAAAKILTWREEILLRLAGQGVLTIDEFPEQLTSPMINRYLEAKAKHLL